MSEELNTDTILTRDISSTLGAATGPAPTEHFKVWVEFDRFGDPKRAAWGFRPPAHSVIQIETRDINTARRTTATLKAAIRSRHSHSQVLGAALSGEY